MFQTLTHRGIRGRAALAAILGLAALPFAVAGATAAGAAAPAGPTAYVTNTFDHTVSPVDLATNTVGTPIPVARYPFAVAITPDAATAYVLSGSAGTRFVTPIDTATNTPRAAIPVPADSRGIAVAPNGATVYVASGSTGLVTPIDVATNTALPPISVPTNPQAIAITPNGATAYVVNGNGDSITPINLATRTLGPAIPAGSGPIDIAITPDGSLAFISSYGNTVTVVNLATAAPVRTIPVAGSPLSVRISPNGTTALVMTADGGVVPIDIASGTVGVPIATPRFTSSASFSPDGATAYLNGPQNNVVLPLNVATRTIGSPITVGGGPQGSAITPDQAPVARLAIRPAPVGAATTLDASSSTVKYGTITRYVWTFGDGATQTTTTPTTTHVYANTGTFPVSVTETDSAGTSTTQAFTGQTMSRNGGPSAVATANAPIPGPIAYTAYVTNSDDNTVTPVNLATNTAGAPIPVGAQPAAIAITPDGKTAYVANDAGDSVTPIDTATNTAGPAIPVGREPFSIAITPDGTTAWVANVADNTITPIDTATNTAGPAISIGEGVKSIAISPDGATLYAIGWPYVTPFNLATRTQGAIILNVNDPGEAAITPDGGHLLTTSRVAFLNDLDLTTLNRRTEGVCCLAGDVAITPNGATAYTGYTGSSVGGLVPIDIATGTVGTTIPTGAAGHGAAITPDGSKAIVTNLLAHSVTVVSTATNTPTATIQVGNKPFAVAVTPDQAPIARLHVDRAPLGTPSTFDASASTVALGIAAAYHWDFGDGATADTTDPVTQHVYNGGSFTAAVTVTSSGGTSTTRTFTGHTVSNNGGPSATAAALGSLAGSGPVVGAVSPAFGPTAGGTTVTVTGTHLSGVTGVVFNGVAAPFTVNSDTSITATSPAAIAGVANVVVTSAAGSSAISPADRFTYSDATPPASCSSALCVVAVQTESVPVAAYLTMSVPCSGCTVTGSIGIGVLGGACNGVPPVVVTAGSTAPDASNISGLVAALSGGFGGTNTACVQETLPLAAAAARGEQVAALRTPRVTRLRACNAKTPKAPCILGNGSTTRLLLPANKTYKIQVGPAAPRVSRLKPTAVAAGDQLTITGRRLSSVTAIVIGGVQATIISQSDKMLVVTVPDGAQTGPVSLIGPAGATVTKKVLEITG